MKALAWLMWIIPIVAAAEAPPVSLSPPVEPPHIYSLKNMRAVSISWQAKVNVASLRQYLVFQNEQGIHHLVYDEARVAPALREISGLREAMVWKAPCSLEIECRVKAVCTSECHEMYYELTNAPADPAFSAHDKCSLRAFSCDHGEAHSLPGLH